MSDKDDERLKAELGAMRLSTPGVGAEGAMRRAAAEQRSRRTMTRMAMAAAGVWLVALMAQVVVERGLAATGQVPATRMTSTAGSEDNEFATGWLVWQRKLAEGLSVEDLGTVVEPPKAQPEKAPAKQGTRQKGEQDQAERGAGRRAYV